MTHTQIQQVIVITLLIAFGGVWAITRKGGGPGLSPVMATAPATRAVPPTPEAGALQGEGASPDSSLARDPFRLPSRLTQKVSERERTLEMERARREQPPIPQAPAQTPPGLSSLALQGIFWGTDRPQAIINRRILSVGDTIEGAEVTAISKEGVTLTHGGQQVELKPSAEVRTGRDDPRR